MTTLIFASLALALFQLWLLPATLNLKNFNYLISSRDVPIDQTILQGRVARAGANFQESWPAFLVIAVLGIIQQVDLSELATIWLGLRVLYILCYMFNIVWVRTIVWLGSLACLICMACKLL